MNGSQYERELANILSADIRIFGRYAKRSSLSESDAASIVEKPFFTVRAAGSLGADLIALRENLTLIIEVKSSSRDSLVFSESSGMRQEQAERLLKMSERAGLFVTYAYRIKNTKGDPWMLFKIGKEPSGSMRYIYRLLPSPAVTNSGNYKLTWKEGFPLSRFLGYVNQE
ncbi:MAG: hypothetical protein M1151_00640 [Candidatus Thermoplasmatota archaeon]|nr:hypothetical protein [Candidatus Thermoplasmatota archaeon]MCL5785161.1 hypothetical protein [Candidatus Thermoplasmatota archaeon]